MDSADLEALIGPPRGQPPPVRWRELEAELGLTFPAEHKELCAKYPTLHFDGFLTWFNPGMWPDPMVAAQGMNDVLKGLRKRTSRSPEVVVIDDLGQTSYQPRFPIYPEPGGVLQWGNTYNGDKCMWLTNPDPNKWTIMIFRGLWWHYESGLLDFLIGTLQGRVRCPLFPEGWPSSLRVEEIYK
ncbi:hypothetical protein [Actinomadura sp. 3N508]|uniref:hypothetical protein n=1 Tax=Actinomadura sp. 3N508 TaxID=3375153 RepID=UPI0037B24DE5